MALVITVSVLLILIVLNCKTTESSRNSDIGVHQLRHSRTEQLKPLDRLYMKLDKTAVLTTTPAAQRKNDFDDFDETTAGSWNSLTDEDEEDSTATYEPETEMSVERRWSKFLESVREKKKEVEEEEEEEDEEDEEDDEEFDSEESMRDSQADGRTYMSPKQTDYSSYKWDVMGNRKSVDNLFHQYKSGLFKPDAITSDNAANYEVYKHNKQMSRETICRVPKPKVVRVSDVYPSTNKLYVPACTILYQCGDDTGCCSGKDQRCGPKTSKMVELYFYTTYISSAYGRQRTSSALEKLKFYNQTECMCQNKLEDLMPRDSGLGSSEFRTDKGSEPSCKCPSEYTVRQLANGSCSCDCFDKQRDCIKYKKGKEYFNHQDRLCIEMGTCHLPSCDFGVYLRSSGRCPRKHEKFRSWSRYH